MFSLKNLFTKKSHFTEAPEAYWAKIPLGIDPKGKKVYWDATYDAHMGIIGGSGTGKTNLMETILTHCVKNGDKIRVVGIDMYKNEMQDSERYSPVVLGVATTAGNALKTLEFAREYMMKNYEEMEKAGVNHHLDLEDSPKLLLVMIDEFSTVLRKYGDADDAIKDEIKARLVELVRLGRAAGVQVVLSSQQMDTDIIPEEIWNTISSHVSMGGYERSAPGRGSITVKWESPVEFQSYRADLKTLDEDFAAIKASPSSDEK